MSIEKHPKYACTHCKKNEWDTSYSKYEYAHYLCMRCKRVVLCYECRQKFRRGGAFGCPTCGYHDQWNALDEDYLSRLEN